MKDLVKYVNENIKDKLSYFISKKLLPEQTVITYDYLKDIFLIASEYFKDNKQISSQLKFILDIKPSKDKSESVKKYIDNHILMKWEYVKDSEGYVEPATEQWDTYNLDNDYYVIPIGTMRIDSGDKFTIIPFVIHKKSLYHCGPAWRGMTFVKTKEDVEKYLLEPVKNALK